MSAVIANNKYSVGMYAVVFWLIGFALEMVNVFLSLSFLKDGLSDKILFFYGLVHGLAAATLILTMFYFATSRRSGEQGWTIGSIVFLLIVAFTAVLSLQGMLDVFSSNMFEWSLAFWVFGLNIVGLLALYFLGNLKFALPFAEEELCDSERKLPGL